MRPVGRAAAGACRSCGADGLRPVIDFGPMPPANALLPATGGEEGEVRPPLAVVFCPGCSLVQITETVPPKTLFADYVYFSSFSPTVVANARDLAAGLAESRGLGPSSLVVEIASNDGYLLRHYRDRGIPVLGIEPAANIAAAAEAQGIPTRVRFFGRDTARLLAAEGIAADIVHANNVLAHVPDLNGFAEGLAAILKPQGVAVIEVPYLRDLIERAEFDTIYHEHVFYFSATALSRLFARHGLALARVDRIPIHGGSLRLFVRHGQGDDPAVRRLLDEERALGLLHEDYYAGFKARVDGLRRDLLGLLGGLKAQGRRIAAYGASAKGTTLLNAFDIGGRFLDFVVDRSTVKQGRRTPGTHLPILPPEALLERRPDFVLLLSWNFAEEILEQQAAYRRAGGSFILPVPEVRVL